MILVTGASGSVGKEVLKRVVASGQPAKALFRSWQDPANVPEGVQVVIADFADAAALSRALQGVDKVFLVCSPIPQLVELETNAISACKRAAIQYVVLSSALGAGSFNASFPGWHAKVEKVLEASGLNFSIVRPNSFMQNIVTYYAPTIRTQGTFYASMGASRVSFIDVGDIGAFVAKLFSTTGHEGRTYELNGPEAFTYKQVADLISQVTGKPVQYVDLPAPQLRQSMLAAGMPEWQADALLDLQRYYVDGGGGKVDSVVAGILGREPTRLAKFLQDSVPAFLPQAVS
jgi:uncharacterized protein YbjT (DUF2867 family)